MFSRLAVLFPELDWQEFSADERQRLLRNLDEFGPLGSAAAQYLRAHATRLGYFPQTRSGAGWTLGNNLTLPPGTDLDDPRIRAVMIHEVLHLQQSLWLRLSIRGELLGWQLEYRAYHEMTGAYYGAEGRPFAGNAAAWAELARLDPKARADLARARVLMKQVSSRYRAHLLPLFPLGREIRYRLARPFRREA